jgi:ribosomal protein L32E
MRSRDYMTSCRYSKLWRVWRYQKGNQNPYVEEYKGNNKITELQHIGQKKKYKRTKNDLQNIHIKLKIE